MKIYQVDAFSQELFKGNPAAVLVSKTWLADDLMQNIALENNLSETAFVKMLDAENFEIRWFSPTTEVDFADMRRSQVALLYLRTIPLPKPFNFM